MLVATMKPTKMQFLHSSFSIIRYEDIPLNTDLYLMDECWIDEYESALVDLFNGNEFRNVGEISRAAVRNIGQDSIELSWYVNISTRFHEVSIILPKDEIVITVDCPDYDEKVHIFVKSSWLSKIHARPYSAFALIDAIGVKLAILKGELDGDRLIRLRNRIDDISIAAPGMSFISFADSLIVKSNWFVGKRGGHSYEPEAIIRIIPEIAAAFKDELGMEIYSVIAQGVNEYPDNSLLHISSSGNHISLNSLGLPFAQLLAIDSAARKSIRSGLHGRSELYIDEKFYHSIRFNYDFDKHLQLCAEYEDPMSSVSGSYFLISREEIIKNLQIS